MLERYYGLIRIINIEIFWEMKRNKEVLSAVKTRKLKYLGYIIRSRKVDIRYYVPHYKQRYLGIESVGKLDI